jgi:hypothetical protein
MQKEKPLRLNTDLLDKVWRTWLADNKPTFNEQQVYLSGRWGSGYATARRNKINKSERFEAWLFREHGGTVRQVAGKLHIEFSTPSQASMFILRYL